MTTYIEYTTCSNLSGDHRTAFAPEEAVWIDVDQVGTVTPTGISWRPPYKPTTLSDVNDWMDEHALVVRNITRLPHRCPGHISWRAEIGRPGKAPARPITWSAPSEPPDPALQQRIEMWENRYA